MARASREQAAQHRAQIVEIAAKSFREHGVRGIGVSNLMAEAGLTHGGFYGHFASKDALVGEACQHAFDQSLAFMQTITARHRGEPASALAGIVKSYLSAAHCASPGEGCSIATLAGDIAHEPAGSEARLAFTSGTKRTVDTLAELMPGKDAEGRHDQALVTLAAMAGAVMIARSVADPELAAEILEATRRAIDRGMAGRETG